jgi:excisionase family DNA binding protein
MTSDPNPTMLSVVDAAARVGLHHRAIRRAISRGELPAVKVCSRIRISEADLSDWIARGRVTAATSSPAPVRPLRAVAPNGLREMLDAADRTA